MNASSADPEHDSGRATPREVWLAMSELVLDYDRRREVSQTLGLSFGRARAIRRLASQPMSMSELATAMNMDPPNTTVLVDDLEALGLARRRQHPTDRRAKIVELTRKGRDLARRADSILATPPTAFEALTGGDLKELKRILRKVSARRSE
jgi:DNA-binding MarR family transcriptional regulator